MLKLTLKINVASGIVGDCLQPGNRTPARPEAIFVFKEYHETVTHVVLLPFYSL